MTRIAAFLFLLFSLNITQAQVKDAISKLEQSSSMAGGSLSLAVIDPENGELVYSHNPNLVMIPASVAKLVSTATAFKILGADYQFETVLGYIGTIDSGVLNGDLVIKGSGDPSMGSTRVEGNTTFADLVMNWSAEIKTAGIEKVLGSLIVYDEFYGTSSTPRNWAWADLGNYYASGVGTLNMNENRIYLTFKSGASGKLSSMISIVPEINGVTYTNEVIAGAAGTGDNAYVFGAPGQNERFVRGTIPPNKSEFTIKASPPDPNEFAGQLFYDGLSEMGIEITGSVKLSSGESVDWEEMTSISSYSSPKLMEIIKATNFYSVNLFAEAVLIHAKKKMSSEEAFPMEQDWLTGYWESKLNKPGPSYLMDGSGLSRSNGMSAKFLAQVLDHMNEYESYKYSIPTAGVSGTVKRLCQGLDCSGKVRAKSGTMNRVKSYAGYIIGPEGKEYPFAIMVNNFSGSSSTIRTRISEILNAAYLDLNE